MGAAQVTRQSRLFIIKETTEGVVVVPAAGTNAIPLQPGFTFVPGIESIQNQELKASIGRAAPIQGIEQPTASFDEYLKHSGVEGQAPNWGPLLESLFGVVASNATERTLTTGSTTTVINAAAGGSDFPTGTVLLLKDGVNGYSIRCSDGVSTNAVTMNFALPGAPATGVKLGKAVTYSPLNSGHPTLSLWLYRGNGGAIEAHTGVRITSLTMDCKVGQLINMKFAAEGIGSYFNPVVITASNNLLDFTDDTGTFQAVIPVLVYKTPWDVARAIGTAMDLANPLKTHTCVYSDVTGKYTISCTGSVLSLLFLSGAGNATEIDLILGFTHTDKTGTGATTGYTSATGIVLTSPYTPSYDVVDPMVAKNMEMLLGTQSSYVAAPVISMSAKIGCTRTAIKNIAAVSGVSGSLFTERQVEIQVIAQLSAYEAGEFDKFINNTDTKFQFSFGVKAGTSWVAGKSGALYVTRARFQKLQLGDDQGIVTLQYTIQGYVDSSGNAEVFLGFV